MIASALADHAALNHAEVTKGAAKELAALPEAQVALIATIGTAESRTPSLSDAFTASQRMLRIQLDILKLETEQQVAIAEIEKVIGGAL